MKYHIKCMVNLTNQYHSLIRKTDNNIGIHTTERVIESHVFAELNTYIE